MRKHLFHKLWLVGINLQVYLSFGLFHNAMWFYLPSFSPTFVVAEEGNSWDVVSANDLWEGENTDLNEDEYVLVRQEDILEGIACFMTAYLESINQTKVCQLDASHYPSP